MDPGFRRECGVRLGEPGLDPGGGVEQRLVAEARADELDAERQPARALAGGQCQAWGPGQGPDRVEARVASRAEPFGCLTGSARGQQQIDIAEEIIDVTA